MTDTPPPPTPQPIPPLPRPRAIALRAAAWALYGLSAEARRRGPADRLTGVLSMAEVMSQMGEDMRRRGAERPDPAGELARLFDEAADWLSQEAGQGSSGQ